MPDRQTIVGWKVDGQGTDTYISQLSFLLGAVGTTQLAGEIHIPPTKDFPQFSDFEPVYLAGQSNALTAINFQTADRGALSGLQLDFEAYTSPMF